MGAGRAFVVWGIGAGVVLLAFMIFVIAGWPGEPNGCINSVPDGCFCEAFHRADVLSHAGGVRQPVNTWFNLYALFTSLLVAWAMYRDRRRGDARNLIRSDNPIADVYIFAVLFLGLGSMWFHASLKDWGGVTDELSMFVYAAFLVFYTIRRLWRSDVFFWIGYPTTVIGFTIWAALWKYEEKSLVLILILVGAYLLFEVIICARTGKWWQGKPLTIALWWCAVGAIVIATVFWALSKTGKPLCDPRSAFQPHGLLWHPLAGVMAVLLYFYWREEEPVT
jgi:hypothetical protein